MRNAIWARTKEGSEMSNHNFQPSKEFASKVIGTEKLEVLDIYFSLKNRQEVSDAADFLLSSIHKFSK